MPALLDTTENWAVFSPALMVSGVPWRESTPSIPSISKSSVRSADGAVVSVTSIARASVWASFIVELPLR